MLDLATILERCRQGDELAWEALVRRFQSRIYATAFHYVRDADEARDLAQEVFVRIYQRLDSARTDGFLPWMLRVARNLCIDRLRRTKARAPLADLRVEDGVEISDGSPGADQAWLTNARQRLVYRALDRMSDKNREMILLKEIQGLNLQEIAQLLDAPIGTIKSRSNRARLELAKTVLTLDPSYGA